MLLSLCLLCVVPAIFSQRYQDQDQEDTTQLILSDLASLDQDVTNIFSLLPQQVDTARLSIANTRARANRFSLSYGMAVALGTLMTIDVSGGGRGNNGGCVDGDDGGGVVMLTDS